MFASRIALLILFFMIRAGGSLAEEVVGRASVIDGDTIEIHGQRIRLHGIDAPESSQLCETPAGEQWRCGQKAALALQEVIGTRSVSCAAQAVDRYGRIVAVCYAANLDLNHWLVSRGLAMAYRRYSLDYVEEEKEARSTERGIWSGRFVAPWDWRRGERLAREIQSIENPRSPTECTIKGNINKEGEHIYHVQGSRLYERTKISPSKGERWFCSEEEARAAGWRPALQ